LIVIECDACLIGIFGAFDVADMVEKEPITFEVCGCVGWKCEDVLFDVDWNGYFLSEVCVMDDGLAFAFVCRPVGDAGVFDELQGCFVYFVCPIVFDDDGVMIHCFGGAEGNGLGVDEVRFFYQYGYLLCLDVDFVRGQCNSLVFVGYVVV